MASHSHEEPSLSPCTMINCFELVTRPARRPAAEESLPLFIKVEKPYLIKRGSRKTLRHFNKDADVARSVFVKSFRTSMVTLMLRCSFFVKSLNMCVSLQLKIVVCTIRRSLSMMFMPPTHSVQGSLIHIFPSVVISPSFLVWFQLLHLIFFARRVHVL